MFRLIPGGSASVPPAPRRRLGKTRSSHLRLVTAEFDASVQEGPAPREPKPLRPLRRPTDVALRLAIWAEAARAAGNTDRADRLCLMAWDAYDRPARDQAAGRS